MTKQRNYTIEFYRIMFALNFIIVHALMVFPIALLRGFPIFVSGLDIILPFMAFSGFFMMQGFEKQQRLGIGAVQSAPRQAWNYLKARLLGLLPIFLLAQIMGFVSINIWQGIPLVQWAVRFLNGIAELVGLQITGLGFGNASVGAWGEGIRIYQMMNTPLWFISGIFVCGYIVYFLLAWNKKFFIGFIAPVSFVLFYASEFLFQTSAATMMWYDVRRFGDFRMPAGVPHMFVGLSLGCLLYTAVDKLRNKKWSKGMIACLTIVQIILTVIVLIRTWAPATSALAQYVNLGWESVHILTIFFSFLVLLNVDKCTRFPLFSGKIWGTPGRMALYIYMLHFPIIVFTGMAMGFPGTVLTPETASAIIPKLFIMTAVSIVVTIIVAYIVMKLDTRFLQPWMKSKPWYSGEQKELEKQDEERQATLAARAVEAAKSGR
jgi:hypothetical protein